MRVQDHKLRKCNKEFKDVIGFCEACDHRNWHEIREGCQVLCESFYQKHSKKVWCKIDGVAKE